MGSGGQTQVTRLGSSFTRSTVSLTRGLYFTTGREKLHMLLISSVCDGVYDFLQRANVAKESLAYKTELRWRED